MIVIHTKRFEIGIHEEDKDMPYRYGWFEHDDYGDEYGGGLWFKDGVLVDYDGIGGYLPAEILDTLEGQGFNVYEMRPDKD